MSTSLDSMRQLANDILREEGVALDHHNAQELAELVEAHVCGTHTQEQVLMSEDIRCAEVTGERDALRAENERLRAALREIRDADEADDLTEAINKGAVLLETR